MEDFKEGTHRLKPTAVPSVNLTTSTENGGASTCGKRISPIATEPATPTKVTITPAFVTPPKEACVGADNTSIKLLQIRNQTYIMGHWFNDFTFISFYEAHSYVFICFFI
ncbi:uncharacterized protein LOC123005279 [Tribolium madens]|uniref:uncharacterized protein LOC123005279 n=1 Tax=Tribolium madens TaxID=41895 RepID=UPI001CF74E69|nr:uncharacterized protein LOC123005279 [Tribolium madens]